MENCFVFRMWPFDDFFVQASHPADYNQIQRRLLFSLWNCCFSNFNFIVTFLKPLWSIFGFNNCVILRSHVVTDLERPDFTAVCSRSFNRNCYYERNDLSTCHQWPHHIQPHELWWKLSVFKWKTQTSKIRRLRHAYWLKVVEFCCERSEICWIHLKRFGCFK